MIKKITIQQLQEELSQIAAQSTSNPHKFFKMGEGQYSHHDKFLGIPTPHLRKLAQQCNHFSCDDIHVLLQSSFNEERLLALIILTELYKKSSPEKQQIFYDFYIKNLDQINNWNLVDSSAHLIVGAHIFKKDTAILYTLAGSSNLWHRRIAIVATWHFIRNNEHDTTIKIAELLLNDSQDLIFKAVGWMLREMGKRNEKILHQFLITHASKMPAIMLSYAIEKFDTPTRKQYLTLRKKSF